MLTDIEQSFLKAAKELVIRQKELLPLLSQSLEKDTYQFWIIDRYKSVKENFIQNIFQTRRRKQRKLECGTTSDKKWQWQFHGLECDMKNINDNRFVRIDFGPAKQHYVITGWGILQFIMCTKAPWGIYADLKEYLTKKTPRDELSGDFNIMMRILLKLEDNEYLVPCDSELCELRNRYTKPDANGYNNIIDIPENLQPECKTDLLVCDRLIISEKGESIL